MAGSTNPAETGQMGVRIWVLLAVVLGGVLGSCSTDESQKADAGDSTTSPSATTDSFTPDPLSGQLIAGISPELGAMLTAGPIGEYYPVQNRWGVLNGDGDVLVLTANYGDP